MERQSVRLRCGIIETIQAFSSFTERPLRVLHVCQPPGSCTASAFPPSPAPSCASGPRCPADTGWSSGGRPAAHDEPVLGRLVIREHPHQVDQRDPLAVVPPRRFCFVRAIYADTVAYYENRVNPRWRCIRNSSIDQIQEIHGFQELLNDSMEVHVFLPPGCEARSAVRCDPRVAVSSTTRPPLDSKTAVL